MLGPVDHVQCGVMTVVDGSLPQHSEEVLTAGYCLVVREELAEALDKLDHNLLYGEQDDFLLLRVVRFKLALEERLEELASLEGHTMKSVDQRVVLEQLRDCA